MAKKIEFRRGDTFYISRYFKDKNGNVIKVNPDTDQINFTVRKDSEDDELVIKKDLSNGIQVFEDGKYRIIIDPKDTQNLSLGKYGYDIELAIGVSEEHPFVRTPETGSIKLTKDYSRPAVGGA
jgi:hypothetical protein